MLRAIGETSHQSCLLLTSREKPEEMALMEGAQVLVRSLLLRGLSPDDGHAIFRQKGAFTGSEAEWQTLICHYSGNPLALKLVAAATQDLFNGSIPEVLTYLAQGIYVFEDIRDLLDRQFDRLSEAEQKTLCWFAILREPIPITDMRETVVDLAVQQICIEFETQQLNFLQTHTLLRVQAKEYIREIKPLRSFQTWKF